MGDSSDETLESKPPSSALLIALWKCAGEIQTIARIELPDVVALALETSSGAQLSLYGQLSGTFLHDGTLALLLSDFEVLAVVRNGAVSLHALPFVSTPGSDLAGVGRGQARRLLLAGYGPDRAGLVLMTGIVHTSGEKVDVQWEIDSRSAGLHAAAQAAFSFGGSDLATVPVALALHGDSLFCRVDGAHMHMDRTPTHLGSAVLRATMANDSHAWECIGRFEERAEPSIGDNGYVSVTGEPSRVKALTLHEWGGAVHDLTARVRKFGKLEYQRFVLCGDFLLVAVNGRVGRLRVH